MRSLKISYFILPVFIFLGACYTGHHGSFVPSTYVDSKDDSDSTQIYPVKGQSCQTLILYLFPAGSPPSTGEAIQSAKDQHEGTKYLTDISIDDRTKWEFGYSLQCIIVEGTAHR